MSQKMSQNGTTSTGPRTEAGKAISSKNALSHGLTASCLVLPWENKADFDGMLNDLVSEHQPGTITEQIMVKEMAENYWRLVRSRNEEHRLLSRAPEILDRAEQDPSAFLDLERCIALTQRYATRFERGFHKCLSTLRILQKERRAKEAEAQAEAEQAATATKVATQQFVSQNAGSAGQFVSQNTPATAHKSSSLNPNEPSTHTQAA